MDPSKEHRRLGVASKPSSEEEEELLRLFIKAIKSIRQDVYQSFNEDSLACSRNGNLQKIKKLGVVIDSLEDFRLCRFQLARLR